MESPLLSPKRCRVIFDEVLRAAEKRGARDVEVLLDVEAEALTRFANNTIHQNVAEQVRHLSVRTLIDSRAARASTNRFDRDSIEKVVDEAIAITRSLEPDPDLLPLAGQAEYAPVQRYFASTAESTPEQRACAVRDAIRVVESAGQTAAGIFSTAESAGAILNSRGVAAYYAETLAVLSVTALAADSSGWAKASATDRGTLDPVALARRASEKASLSRRPREIPAGRYTVILEPAAVLDLVGQMTADFSATAMADRRSFLNDRLGKKIFGDNIGISDDVSHPLQAGAPFDGEGVPRSRLTLVDAGVPTQIAYSRTAAHKENRAPTGHGFPPPNEYGEAPANIVIAGGDTSMDQMVASTGRGVLVTRFWYIREVDPYEKIMTGMTRDGTFLVEDGKVVCGLKNFRFNQGLIELLGNVEALGPSERASGEEAFDMVVPPMKVREFAFTEVTTF